MALTLANLNIVLSGTFDGRDNEDVHWALVALGAYVKTSVTKTTAALIVGDEPQARHLAGAEKHSTPIVDQDGLEALLAGATLDAVLAGDTVGPAPRDLEGWTVSISGELRGRSAAALGSALEARGAKVVGKPSRSCDLLVLGDEPSEHAVRAQDEGVPFLRGEEIESLAGGTPIGDLVAAPTEPVTDRHAAVEAQLDALFEELTSIDAGERWEDELTLRVEPSGRAILELREMGGTPIHDYARRVIQRHGWPMGDEEVVLTRPVVWT